MDEQSQESYVVVLQGFATFGIVDSITLAERNMRSDSNATERGLTSQQEEDEIDAAWREFYSGEGFGDNTRRRSGERRGYQDVPGHAKRLSVLTKAHDGPGQTIPMQPRTPATASSGGGTSTVITRTCTAPVVASRIDGTSADKPHVAFTPIAPLTNAAPKFNTSRAA